MDAHSNLYPRNINLYNTGIYNCSNSNCVLPVPIGSIQIVCYPCLSGAREIQTLKPTYSRHTVSGHFCLWFSWSAHSNWQKQPGRIDKSNQVRLKSWETSWIGLLVSKKRLYNTPFELRFTLILNNFYKRWPHLQSWSMEKQTFLFNRSLIACIVMEINSIFFSCGHNSIILKID